ncbi:DoxX family protein [Runella salmonicolor]|uniref:DoxX family protein n=1 Tax=Runella salmonicolor TaxID=2950278 RepID=A0ABT1FT40_9BACT|nr:DoxX family protein [Runella salmonicolor]MCP1384934.1 DoxX family protein [Runella salmonicolor]
MKNQTLLRLLAVALGVIYLISGIGKAMDINTFTDIVAQYSHLKMRFIAPLIVGTEITLGFGLILGAFPRQFAAVSLCVLVFFTIFLAIGFASGKLDDCGCFGILLKIDPLVALLRNVGMLTISYLLYTYSQYDVKRANWLFGGALLFGVLAFVITGFEMKNTYRPLELHIGSKLDKTFLASYTKSHQKQLFFVFSPTCPHCLAATETVKQYIVTNSVNEVIGFYPSQSKQVDIESFKSKKKPNFKIIAIKSDTLHKIVRSVPVAFLVENGEVKHIYNGEIPRPQ